MGTGSQVWSRHPGNTVLLESVCRGKPGGRLASATERILELREPPPSALLGPLASPRTRCTTPAPKHTHNAHTA
ncbi:hypothetical protein E2C01_067996 [Portunus trituberculatus]|uniref:Uncharacterized protein n=1 Tax=Portunus trituberculatus TaxID=210409 RepID=A0A5B7HMK6_PORTR|nr:hypothetical protein [Portunus trituberculatus]